MYAIRRASSQFSGPTGIAGTCPAIAASIPSHITGATAGRASRFAGSAVIDTASKWCAIRGAVASVAAIVIAAPSASARCHDRRPSPGRDPVRRRSQLRIPSAHSRIPATAAKLSCHPTSELDRGLTTRVTSAANTSTYQRERGRP